MARVRQPIKIVGAALLIGLAVLLIYRAILFPPAGDVKIPWASDTQGHLLKVDYLQENLSQGRIAPQILPEWYMGMEFMRYYPPLPYYFLVLLSMLIGNAFSAANWFIGLCALAGGLSWLLYRRWIGILPALIGGVLFTFLPDNVRVALAEGNLPRVLATALLPVTIYLLMRTIDKTGTNWHRIGLTICFALIVLSHTMMAAIYAVCCGLILLVLIFKRSISVQAAFRITMFILLGIMISAWWLLPSFSGGITDLNTSAMTEALEVFPITNYLNPGLRVGNPEAYYVGMALLALSVVSLWVYQEKRGFTTALTLTGCFGVLITTSGFNQFFNALPLHNLLWPLRFLGIASFALLLALMWSLRGWKDVSPLVGLAVVAVIAIDGAGSFFLIGLRPADPDIEQITQRLAVTKGWREATLDLSRLGSGPSMSFTTQAGREQVFGWAYQGARTA
ncbi:MAG: 6-pyruvoyl-tetrahydropterin synthase-related protein, partial [Anaerolineales bacterium]